MSQIETQLYQTAALTFEELVFMFPMPELGDEYAKASPEATATVDFRGPIDGRLEISVAGGLLPVLAANMLGQNDVPTDREQLDALGEVANVICGNVLPKLAGSVEVFHIDAPRVTPGQGALDFEGAGPTATTSLPLSDGKAELKLFITN